MLKGHKPLKGDTLIEVMFAVAIFGLAAVGTIALMNRGLASTQNSLETTMARQEIDAQAEALRFLHGAYISEPKKADATPIDQVCSNPTSYRDLWKCLTTNYVYTSETDSSVNTVTSEDPDFFTRTTTPGHYCDDLFRTNSATSFSVPSKSFILNPRSLDISDLDTTDDITNVLKKTIVTNDVQTTRLNLAGTYPRLLYRDSTNTSDGNNLSDATIGSGNFINYGDDKKTLEHSEGIWVTSVASPSGVQCKIGDSGDVEFRPDYYDFHIQTCWDSAASNSASTIKSTVRLFNPDQIALVNKSSQLKLEDMALFFVMTWKGSNTDIDAHLTGSSDRASGGSAFHVYYSTPTAGEEKTYSFITSGQPARTFQLDVDARAVSTGRNYCTSQDRWCGDGNGDGYVEVIAVRGLFPATFSYYAHDYGGYAHNNGQENEVGSLADNNLRVRVFVGQADSGIGQWPHDTEPIATFDYSGSGDYAGNWNVAQFEVKADGTFEIGGETHSLAQALPEVTTVTSDGTCTRVGQNTSNPGGNIDIDPDDGQRPDDPDTGDVVTPVSTTEAISWVVEQPRYSKLYPNSGASSANTRTYPAESVYFGPIPCNSFYYDDGAETRNYQSSNIKRAGGPICDYTDQDFIVYFGPLPQNFPLSQATPLTAYIHKCDYAGSILNYGSMLSACFVQQLPTVDGWFNFDIRRDNITSTISSSNAEVEALTSDYYWIIGKAHFTSARHANFTIINKFTSRTPSSFL